MLCHFLPPLHCFFHIFITGIIFEIIRLIGDDGNDAIFQAILHLFIQTFQQFRCNLIGNANTHMVYPCCCKISRCFFCIVFSALIGLAPVRIHAMAQHILIYPRCNGCLTGNICCCHRNFISSVIPCHRKAQGICQITQFEISITFYAICVEGFTFS